MDSASLLEEARLTEALAVLKDEVRQSPGQVDLRLRLFALNCLLGRLDKATADLEAITALDADWVFSAQVYQSLLGFERLRQDAFSGGTPPSIMGEPPPWLAWNLQALKLEAEGQSEKAWTLREHAWDASPEIEATVDESSCPWLSDADARFGPVLEASLDGNYYWIPFTQLQRIEITAPEVLVEYVWVPAKLMLSTGAEVRAHLPGRYPGTEGVADGPVCLGQRTEWEDIPGGGARAIGQKLFQTEDADFGILGCRSIELQPGETGDGV